METDGLKRQLQELGVDGLSCVDIALAGQATADDVQSAIDSARDQIPAPPPSAIYGRVKALHANPRLASAPWPASIAATQRLRREDFEHHDRKRRNSNRIRELGQTDLSESLAAALADSADYRDPDWSWRKEREAIED